MLGAILGQTDRNAEALTAIKMTVTLSPKDAEAHYNLGVTLQKLLRSDEAEASFKQAIALQPDYAIAHFNLASTLHDLGRLDEVEACFNKAIALQPDHAKAHHYLTTMKKFVTKDEQYSKLHELYLDEEISEEQLCHINFALAKASEDSEDFDQAFTHYSEGNALRKKLLNYDIS